MPMNYMRIRVRDQAGSPSMRPLLTVLTIHPCDHRDGRSLNTNETLRYTPGQTQDQGASLCYKCRWRITNPASYCEDYIQGLANKVHTLQHSPCIASQLFSFLRA